MSYADIASKMIVEDSIGVKHFKLDTNQLVFKNYSEDAVFSLESCTKEQMDTFVRYMQMYGGGSWHDGMHNDVPYYYTNSKTENVKPLGISWTCMQDVIKGDYGSRISNTYQKSTGRKIAIPYLCIGKEYVFTDMPMSVHRFINAMRAYYNRLKFDYLIRLKINDFLSSLRFAMIDLFDDAITNSDQHKMLDLYDGISVDYCAYDLNSSVRWAPNSCFVGRLYLVDSANDEIGYKCLDGRFTTNNVKVLIESTRSDYDITLSDILGKDAIEDSPMEFVLYDNSGEYGYCVRIMSKSKSLLFVILKRLLEEYNCNSMENLNNG